MVVFCPMGRIVGESAFTLAWYDESPQSVHFKFKLPPSTMGSPDGSGLTSSFDMHFHTSWSGPQQGGTGLHTRSPQHGCAGEEGSHSAP